MVDLLVHQLQIQLLHNLQTRFQHQIRYPVPDYPAYPKYEIEQKSCWKYLFIRYISKERMGYIYINVYWYAIEEKYIPLVGRMDSEELHAKAFEISEWKGKERKGKI